VALLLAAQHAFQGEEEVSIAGSGNRSPAPGAVPERRAFFRTFLGETDADTPGFRRPLDARRIALLKEIAGRWVGGLPRGATLRIDLSAACKNHGTCVAVCPTGALRSYAEEALAGIEFEAGACIGCGVCAMVCPESALAIAAATGAPADAGSASILSRHAQRECARCDNAFTLSGDEELCPACRKDVSLFANPIPTRSDAA
jgi:Pyruvate/2-oxoacid:ferredoxin oxidoreductase delta subunit